MSNEPLKGRLRVKNIKSADQHSANIVRLQRRNEIDLHLLERLSSSKWKGFKNIF